MSGPENQILGMQEQGQNTAASTLHLMFRFLRTVRLRSGILVATLVISSIAGATYFITAQRIYQSNASLYIVRKGGNVTEETPNSGSSANSDMPTFIELMSRDEVIVRALKTLPKNARVDLVGYPEGQWVRTIKDNLSVSCAFSTTVLDLSYKSKDPKAAQAVLRSMLAAYVEFLDDTHNGSSEESIRKLKQQLKDDNERLTLAEAERLRLRNSAPELVETGDKNSGLSIVSETIRLLNIDYSAARRISEQSRTQFDGLQRAIASGEDIIQFANKTLDTAGRQLIEQSMGLGSQDAFLIQRINQELLDLESQLSDARTRYGENHSKIKALTENIQLKKKYLEEYPRQQQQEMKRLAETELAPRMIQYLRQQMESNQQNEDAIRAQLDTEKNKAQRLGQILADLARNERENLRLSERIQEYQNQVDGIGINKDKMVITSIPRKPTLSTRPVNPRLAITGILSLMLGSIAGLGIIWVLDIMDDRFRTPEELKLQLDTQVLSMIPRMEELQGEGFAAVMCHSKPHSKEVEAFRALRTSIEFSPQETNRLVCTSTEPGDGKTTVSSNLAVAFAQSGKRTLIIDADMRRPGLSTLLGLRDDTGLSKILRDSDELEVSIERNLRKSDVKGLDVISCGPRPVNPAELLSSERFSNMLAWAETKYDQIIVDAPPVLAVSDPAIVGRLVDAVILVVRPDKDRRRMVIRATETLQTLGCTLLGVVINHLTTTDTDGYGYGYGYGYGHENEHEEQPERDVASGLSALASGKSREADLRERNRAA